MNLNGTALKGCKFLNNYVFYIERMETEASIYLDSELYINITKSLFYVILILFTYFKKFFRKIILTLISTLT